MRSTSVSGSRRCETGDSQAPGRKETPTPTHPHTNPPRPQAHRIGGRPASAAGPGHAHRRVAVGRRIEVHTMRRAARRGPKPRGNQQDSSRARLRSRRPRRRTNQASPVAVAMLTFGGEAHQRRGPARPQGSRAWAPAGSAGAHAGRRAAASEPQIEGEDDAADHIERTTPRSRARDARDGERPMPRKISAGLRADRRGRPARHRRRTRGGGGSCRFAADDGASEL